MAPEHVLRDFDPAIRPRVIVIPSFSNRDLPALLRGYQIKLFPTLFEGFSKALLEAMSCGLAAVTTDLPGLSGFVSTGIDGLTIEPRNPKAIEGALRTLIQDRALLDRMRRSARQKAQSYGWNQIAARRLAAYEEFIAWQRPSNRLDLPASRMRPVRDRQPIRRS